MLGEKIEVTYPIYDLMLFKAIPKDEGYFLSSFVDKREFDRKFEKACSIGSEFLRRDLPRFTDFSESLLASGVIHYKNLGEFKQRLENTYNSLKKGVIFCPDTNVLYHRFFSNFFDRLPERIGIVDIVKNEIEGSMNSKYRREDIESYFNLPNGFLMRDLRNRRDLRSRRAAYLAMEEFKYLKPSVLIISSKGIKGKNNDERIVKAIKKFDNQNPTLAVLLTADVPLTDVAEMEGIEYFLFELPRVEELSGKEVNARTLRRLIFTLSSIFGVIKVNSCIIHGEFGGKTDIGEMKVSCEEDLGKELRKHLEICRALMSFGISD